MGKEGQILQGVAIPTEAVAKSNALKAKRGKTLASLPVFRDAASLLLDVILIVKGGPRSLRGFYDEVIGNTTEIMKTIGMADASLWSPEDRIWYLNNAISLAEVEKSYITTLRKAGILSEDAKNKLVALVKRIIAQLVGWREKTRGEGAVPSVKTNNPEDVNDGSQSAS
jgi:hypothetical protein